MALQITLQPRPDLATARLLTAPVVWRDDIGSVVGVGYGWEISRLHPLWRLVRVEWTTRIVTRRASGQTETRTEYGASQALSQPPATLGDYSDSNRFEGTVKYTAGSSTTTIDYTLTSLVAIFEHSGSGRLIRSSVGSRLMRAPGGALLRDQ